MDGVPSFADLLASVQDPSSVLSQRVLFEGLQLGIHKNTCISSDLSSESSQLNSEENIQIPHLSVSDWTNYFDSGQTADNVDVEEVSELFSDQLDSDDDSEDDVRAEEYMLPINDNYTDDDCTDGSGDDSDDSCKILPASFPEVGTTEVVVQNLHSNPIQTCFEGDLSSIKKRKRYPKGQKLPNCRETRTMGAIEIAMRAAMTRTTEHIFEPIVGVTFDSAAEAYEFYNLYSWEVGFGISYGNSDTNRGNQYRTMQELICCNAGYDNRCNVQSQRNRCPARIKLLRTEDHGWYIRKVVADHNHTFSESCGEKMQWRSHRKIDDCAKNMIKNLRDNNVPLGKVHSIMGSIYGGVKELPFTKRSLRTLCQQLAKEQMDDDVKKTLEIFRKMRLEDPDFTYSVDVDRHNRIKTLIWTTHRSKMQYACFGDAFTFDTTYCTNIYKMPFGLFVGVNNHFQSIIYAGVLMREEKVKSFIWVFNEFISMMGGKAPETILTDQAKAMRKALKKSMPNTTHLWCKWHVLRKAKESLGPIYTKNAAFRQQFSKVINEMLTVDEFELAWKGIIDTFKLTMNPFMIRIYQCRSMWAKPFSKDKFCARMMSTQRVESANHMLKTYVRGNSSMNNFVEKYNDMMHDRAMEEDREEHKTKVLKKPSSKMWPLQNHAYKIYTRAAFKLFNTELEKSYHFVVVPGSEDVDFEVRHAHSELREAWVRVSFKVTVKKALEEYNCECGLYTHFGMLCCHAIRVMNYEGVPKIPQQYILKRWTKNARDVLPENLRYLQKDNRAMKSHTFRDSLLYGTAMKAVKLASGNMETFNAMMKSFGSGIKEVNEIIAAKGDSVDVDDQSKYESSDAEWYRTKRGEYHSEPELGSKGKKTSYGNAVSQATIALDVARLKAPLIQKSGSGRKRFKRFLSPTETNVKSTKKTTTKKGSTSANFKQTTFCSICRQSGHNRNTCSQNPDAGKIKRKKSCCSTCKMPGHSANKCYNLLPCIDDFNINDLCSDEE